MITFGVRITVPPEKRKEVLETLRLVRGPTIVQPGCISFQVYQEVDDANVLIFVEEWESQAELDNHLRCDDFRKILALMELSSELPEIRFESVSYLGGLGVIEEARGVQPSKH